jgi:hypothetical protein
MAAHLLEQDRVLRPRGLVHHQLADKISGVGDGRGAGAQLIEQLPIMFNVQ